jgi:glyoxylase-like metal-dependent hydrolase (beta-lactamase superfamily II)
VNLKELIMVFRQLFDTETSTYTYLLADNKSKEAIIIDSVKENVERDLHLIQELGLRLIYTIETHIHADHITGAGDLSLRTGAKRVVPKNSQVECADILLADGDELKFGDCNIKAIHTPGHTDTCTSYLIDNMVFTGDALFIRGNGRTDFQNGSAEALYDSITKKLFTLPDDTFVYPGHDYKGMNLSTIKEEKQFNPRIKIGTTKDEFINTMNTLKLVNPKKIQEAVPANLKCGKETNHAV